MVRNRSADGEKRGRQLRRAAATGQHRTPRRRRAPSIVLSLLVVLASGILTAAISSPAQAVTTLPPGFQEKIVFSGLTNPTAVRFAPDGRVFVAEKRGVIKVFDSLTDTSPDVFADLNANVYNFWDRGLLGMALDPNFAANPYVYVLYTFDHELGSPATPPRWGTQGVYSDPCPIPTRRHG
jgi:glucose/arabinose dehydrogenase